MNKIKVPKNQIRWLTYFENGTPKYIITSSASRETYYLYEVAEDGTTTKVESSKRPLFKRLGDKN